VTYPSCPPIEKVMSQAVSLVWKATPDCRITPVVLGAFTGTVRIAIGRFRARIRDDLLGINHLKLASSRHMVLRNGRSLLGLYFGEKHGDAVFSGNQPNIEPRILTERFFVLNAR
jgi:hypothetical protein